MINNSYKDLEEAWLRDLIKFQDAEEDLSTNQVSNISERITPELLQYFTREEAEELLECFTRTPSAETHGTYNIDNLSKEAKNFLSKEITGKRIIELGTGQAGAFTDKDNPFYCISGKFNRLGAKEWCGVDPKCNYDGLTFLLKQPDESAIVTSFGVLEEGVLYRGFNESEQLKKYQQELGRQIYRVTPKGAITFHGLEWDLDLVKAGFIDDENVPSDLRKGKQGHNRFRVLRKIENSV